MRSALITRRRPAISGGVYDPAVLSLTGWWPSPYSGSPLVGAASAGTSLGRDLSEATNPPAVGSGAGVGVFNGYAAPDLDGVNDKLDSPDQLGTFIDVGAFAGWVAFYADAVNADNGSGSRWANAQFMTNVTDADFGVGISDAGVHAYCDPTAGKELVIACGTGAPHAAFFRYTGTDLELAVDSGSWSTVTTSNVATLTRLMRFGTRYNAAVEFFNGRILDMGISDVALSRATLQTDVKSYINARYALSL